MGAPFTIVQGSVLVIDDTGKIIKLSSGRDLFTSMRTEVSDLNSYSTALASGANFTGTFVDVLEFANLSVIVKASHASAVGGLLIEWSSDGINVDDSDSFDILAANGKQFSFGIMARYVRVGYTNGATLQTYFRLQTLLHRTAFKPSSHRIDSSIVGTDDAELVKSIITGKAPSGSYKNVNIDEDGNLSIALADGAHIIPTLGQDLRYEDMNAGTGGIARGTSIVAGAGWSKVYEYNGSGLLLGFLNTLETLDGTSTNYWSVRLVVDGDEIFGAVGANMNDFATSNIYNFNVGTTPSPIWAGLNLVQNTFSWTAPSNLPLTFASSVKIYVSRTGTVAKLWRAGAVSIVKES